MRDFDILAEAFLQTLKLTQVVDVDFGVSQSKKLERYFLWQKKFTSLPKSILLLIDAKFSETLVRLLSRMMSVR